MAKFEIFVFLGLVAIAYCAPAEPEPVPIVAQVSDIQPDGAFKWSFETGDGAKQEQTGELKQVWTLSFLTIKKLLQSCLLRHWSMHFFPKSSKHISLPI